MDDELPPYAFFPGGPWPHPMRTAAGHSFDHKHRPPPPPIDPADWQSSSEYLLGFRLWNAGYYWEAHETWEGLWHAHQRRGPIADLLKALIKLAAAGVKVREGQPPGTVSHSSRAANLIASIRSEIGPTLLGMDLISLQNMCERVALSPPGDSSVPGDRVHRVFDFEIHPHP